MEAANDLLEKYKKHPFAKGLLPFRPTLNALGMQFSKVDARQEGRQRWVICDSKTGEPALFSHATRYSEGDNVETGNYVPAKETIPVGLDPKDVQRRANARCFYTYIFDTYGDLSLYEGQWALDEYISHVKGFNPGSLPRRAYLSGKDEKYRSRFWMQTPMFLRRGPEMEEANIEYLHPWVLEAQKYSKVFRANPDRPRIWVKDGDNLLPIAETEPGILQRGDILAVSFSVTYHITSVNWFPQFHPADIVVMRSGDGDATDYSAPAIGLHMRPPPSLEDGSMGGSTEQEVNRVGEGEPEVGETRSAETVEDGEVGGGQQSGGDGTVGRPGALEEVGRGDKAERGRSADTIGSSTEAEDGGDDAFEFEGGEDDGSAKAGNEARDGITLGKRAARSSGGRGGRSVRRRT